MPRLRNAMNAFSTGFTRWWYHSSLRAVLNGSPRGAPRRLAARRRRRDGAFPRLGERVNRERIAAIERILAEDDPATP
jgi:hypothetical protein